MLLGHEMQQRWLCVYSVNRILLSTPKQVQRHGGYSRRWNNFFQAIVLCYRMFLSPEANYFTHPEKTSKAVSLEQNLLYQLTGSSSHWSSVFLLPHVHHILMAIGRRISAFNCLVQLPSSAAGCFAKAPTQEMLASLVCLWLVASCPAGFCKSQPPARGMWHAGPYLSSQLASSFTVSV